MGINPNYTELIFQMLVSAEHLCDLPLLFMRIQNLVTIFGFCTTMNNLSGLMINLIDLHRNLGC